MIKKYQASANIYNYQIRTGITQSAYLNKNGEQITNVSYEISYPIAIKPNTTYTWQFGGTTIHAAPTVCFYDSSDNLISGVAHTGGTYFSFNSPSNAAYLKASVYTSSANQAVLHEGSTFIDYVPYGLTAIDWFYRKYETATDTYTSLPQTIIGDGTAISAWSMKGNMTQSGTPTPANPIYPTECGEKTANLLDISQSNAVNYSTSSAYAYTINSDRTISVPSGKAMYTGFKVKVSPNTTYTIHSLASTNGQMRIREYSGIITDWTTNYITQSVNQTIGLSNTVSFTTTAETEWVLANWYIDGNYSPCVLSELELLEGAYTQQTLPTYEPYGYKIPISFGQGTYTNYLSEPIREIGDSVDTVPSSGTASRNIKKMVLTGNEAFWGTDGTLGSLSRYTILPTGADAILRGSRVNAYCSHYIADADHATNTIYVYSGSTGVYMYFYVPTADYPTLADYKSYVQQQYANGTPITLWYILETATTETFTAPSIPTSGSPQSFDVSTTLKPSEVSLTYHGWHEHEDTKFTT